MEQGSVRRQIRSKRKKKKKTSRNRDGVNRRAIFLQVLAILFILAILGLVRWYGG